MKETVTISVDKEIADAIQIIQALKECGVVSVSSEMSSMEKLLSMAHSAFVAKLNGEREFTLEQGILIWKTWFRDVPINELFDYERGKTHEAEKTAESDV